MIKVLNDSEFQKAAEMRDMALAQLPQFVEIKEIEDLLASDDLGDEVSEMTLDSLASFNEDMKILALNAFQVQDLLKKCLQENELLIDWMSNLEYQTFDVEDKMV